MDCEDSSYNSTSEPELDSDPEDPERLLNEWLGELDSLTVVSTGMCRRTGSRYQRNRKWKQIPADYLYDTLATVTSFTRLA